MYNNIYGNNFGNVMSNWFFGAWMVALGTFFALFMIAVYIYFALALMKVGEKLKYEKSWLAWIPVVNIAMILQLGEFHWAWTFLILIPIFGWIALFVLIIIASGRIFEKTGYPGWFSISLVLPKVGPILYLIALGFAGWGNEKVTEKTKKNARKRK